MSLKKVVNINDWINKIMCGFTVLDVLSKASLKLLLFMLIFSWNIGDECHSHAHYSRESSELPTQQIKNLNARQDGKLGKLESTNINTNDDVDVDSEIEVDSVGLRIKTENTNNVTQQVSSPWQNRNRWLRKVALHVGYARFPFDITPKSKEQILPVWNQQVNGTYFYQKIQLEDAVGNGGKHNSTRRNIQVLHPKQIQDEYKSSISQTNTLPNRKSRRKRGVVQLYNMVSCATGCDPLIYKGYGCYCGFLGSGYPVDGIDKCCKMHDICYDVANCPMYLEYIVPYYWKCYRGKSLCAIDQLDLGGSGSCAQRLCECDRLLSECLSRFPCPRRRAKCVSSPWRLLQNTLMFF